MVRRRRVTGTSSCVRTTCCREGSCCSHRYLTSRTGLEMAVYHTHSRVQSLSYWKQGLFQIIIQFTHKTLLFLMAARAMLIRAVKAVTEDKRFKLPSPQAADTFRVAPAFYQWCTEPEHNELLTTFTKELSAKLKTCFHSHSSLRRKREMMWGSYHQLRTSLSFEAHWTQFLEQSIGHHAGLAFVQFITDTIFKELIKLEFLVSTATTTSESPHCPLSYEEQNVLRYVAGYVCRKVRTKLETSTLPSKDEMIIICIMEMSEDEEGDGGTETRTNLVDRGGLWHTNNQTYRLFVAMEYSIHQCLTMATASKQEGARSHLI